MICTDTHTSRNSVFIKVRTITAHQVPSCAALTHPFKRTDWLSTRITVAHFPWSQSVSQSLVKLWPPKSETCAFAPNSLWGKKPLPVVGLIYDSLGKADGSLCTAASGGFVVWRWQFKSASRRQPMSHNLFSSERPVLFVRLFARSCFDRRLKDLADRSTRNDPHHRHKWRNEHNFGHWEKI